MFAADDDGAIDSLYREEKASRTEQAHAARKELTAAGRLGLEELWMLAERWCAGLPANAARAYREAIRAWLV